MAGTVSSGVHAGRPSHSQLVDYSPYTEKGFWAFVAERQRIWHRKEVQKQPPPWAEDPILQQFHFCNVYRELDKGTQYYIRQMRLTTGFEDALWCTICYRLVNSQTAFETIGGFYPRREWRNMILALRIKGVVLNSRAYLTLPYPHELPTRLDRFEHILAKLETWFDGLVELIREAKTLRQVSESLQQVYGVGPFVAMQIYRDLIIVKQLPFSDNDWTEIGPSTAECLKTMFPYLPAKRHRDLIYDLARRQREGLPKDFDDMNLGPISVGDIEHVLCEYNKHCKLRLGHGRKRYYNKTGPDRL